MHKSRPKKCVRSSSTVGDRYCVGRRRARTSTVNRQRGVQWSVYRGAISNWTRRACDRVRGRSPHTMSCIKPFSVLPSSPLSSILHHVPVPSHIHRDLRILAGLRCRRWCGCIRHLESPPSQERELAGSVYVHMAGTSSNISLKLRQAPDRNAYYTGI